MENDKAYKLSIKYKEVLKKGDIISPLRLAHFFAQIKTESNLEPKRESLYYTTVSRAKRYFYTPFYNKSYEFVLQYLRNTKKMANYVYANRMGNGNEASGDGYRFRGGGDMQISGRRNYEKLSKDTGIDFVTNPDLIIESRYSLESSVWYWTVTGLNKFADDDNIDAISDLINKGKLTPDVYGDTNDFDKRVKWLEHYKKVFNVTKTTCKHDK